MNNTVIKLEHVSKKYSLGDFSCRSLKEEVQRLQAKLLHKDDPIKKVDGSDQTNFLALNDISFEVKKSERLGIIGHNGAGKSTLLKLISRITIPTAGEIGINGRVASMLEIGTGFHPELTGRENIYINGAILGMKKEEINKKLDSIIDFSEIGEFIDTPVKRYSSGMYVKLAFSVASHLDAEIIIMDEVLAVGDIHFQKKCIKKMLDVAQDENKTILFVSHGMQQISDFCTRCIVLEHGKIIFDGDTSKAIELYKGA